MCEKFVRTVKISILQVFEGGVSPCIAGKEEAETALLLGDQSSECHQWYVITSFGKEKEIKLVLYGFVFCYK